MKIKKANKHCGTQNTSSIKRLLILVLASLFSKVAISQSDYDPLAAAKLRFLENVNPKTRIVGGHDSTIAENPWQVALLYAKDNDVRRAQFCGGTFIANNWILTAAHCVDSAIGDKDVDIYVSSEKLSSQGIRLSVDAPVLHPSWNRSRFDSDIALLKIRETNGNKYGIPLILDDGKVWGPDTNLRITGWGITSSRNAGTDTLQMVEIPLIHFLKCSYSYGSRITPNMICAGRRGADACSGDSGGPASTELRGVRYLVGVTSWGDGCGIPNRYGVFSKVANFSKWIKAQIASSESR